MPETTILLAEDEPNDIFFTRRAFEKAQLSNPIQVVHDGQEAIDYLAGQGIYSDRQKYPFPLMLLMDLRMPRKSGFEVLEWLRQHTQLRLKAVVLTSSDEGPDVAQAYALGASSHLVKPPQPDALKKLFERLSIASA